MALTHDGFLGGRVMAWQPKVGYRAGTDPVFLAAACPAKAGDSALELGCGVGVAALCLAARVSVDIVGVERQADYAALARRNGVSVVEADLASLPADLRQRSFDHVLFNPPFYGAGTGSSDAGRNGALREQTPLAEWFCVAKARLKPGGWLTVIHLAERLPDLLKGLEGCGAISVLPLSAREGRSAGRVVVRARKGARGAFRLLPPFLLHDGASHAADGDDYSASCRAILREGAPLAFD